MTDPSVAEQGLSAPLLSDCTNDITQRNKKDERSTATGGDLNEEEEERIARAPRRSIKFIALQVTALLTAAVAYGVAFRAPRRAIINIVLVLVVWSWLILGLVVATACWSIANLCLATTPTTTGDSTMTKTSATDSERSKKQVVEWRYAFDVHCHAFLPVFWILCTTFNRPIPYCIVQRFD